MSEHANSHQYLTNHEALSSRNNELEGLKMTCVYQTLFHYHKKSTTVDLRRNIQNKRIS